MSIASELTKLETDITNAYDAVQIKGGTIPSDKNTNNLPNAINSIPSGGIVEVEEKDIIFIDCDGAILYSYTLQEMQQLTELPQLPTAEGFTYQEWNWTLADIKAYNKPLIIGAVRTTNDGKTWITVEFQENDYMYAEIRFNQTNVDIDWGDGTIETVSRQATHTYSTAGKYIIKLDTRIAVTAINNNISQRITEIAIGNTSNAISANKLYLIKKYSISKSVSSIPSSCFNTSRVKCVVLPSTITTVSASAFQGSQTKLISIPNSITYLSDSFLYNNVGVERISMANLVVNNNISFRVCKTLKTTELLEGMQTINSSIFRDCASLMYINIPSTVTEIKNNCFQGCNILYTIDLSALTTVPTLEDANAFNKTLVGRKFYVKNQTMLDAFESATNWSVFAGQFVIGGKYAS